MVCKYCEESDVSKLIERSKWSNGETKTIYICTFCLWFILLNPNMKDENRLSAREQLERKISQKRERSYSSMGQDAGGTLQLPKKIRNEILKIRGQNVGPHN